MAETAPLETALGNFMAITAKSTVAIIIPLYGYWNDVPENPVNGEVLNAVLRRVYSNIHHLILVFVAHPQSVPHDPKDKDSVGNILLAKAAGGNVLNVSVGRDATYTEYITEGLDAAMNGTKASFFVVFNPWVLIQDGAIDVLIDRANFGDNAKIISGFDVREAISPEAFDIYKTSTPREQLDLSLNFLGMPRFVAEMLQLDPEYKTHKWLERDMWQRMFSTGFDVITSQRLPIFPFDFPWNSYETKEQFDGDRAHFIKKWGFNVDLNYKD
jgi:hypothetical protein